MTRLLQVSLENEMDLTIAYKRSISTGAMLGLTRSTQTTFATAVSEVCREVIDKADQGSVSIGVEFVDGRFMLIAEANFNSTELLTAGNPGIDYARKLVPILEINHDKGVSKITLKLGIPNSTKLDQNKIKAVQRQIITDGPVSAYEEVKLKNAALSDLNQQNEVALHKASNLDKLKTEFLSVASHELNSPLTILLGLCQLAKTKSSHEPLLHNILTKTEDQTRKIISLVRQLLDVSKFEHGIVAYDQQILSISDFFNAINDGLSLLTPKHQLVFNISAHGNILVDSLRLEQVVTNLVNNAAKYSPVDSEIILSAWTDNMSFYFSVTDHGLGMSEQTRLQIFDKFFREKQVEKKYSGLGMGLYIVNRIITDHMGSIQVESTLGKGSVFTLTLPIYKS